MRNLIVVGTTPWEDIIRTIREDGISIYNPYRGENSLFLCAIRIFMCKYGGKLGKLWVKRQRLIGYDAVIVFDEFMSIDVLKTLYRKIPDNSRKIFYYWNMCADSAMLDEIKAIGYDVWSFDQGDCLKHNLKYNPQFFADSWYENLEHNKTCYDISFVGRAKGNRINIVERILKKLLGAGLTVNSYYVADKWYKRYNDKRYKRKLTFGETIEIEHSAKAVLDIVIERQSGSTLRLYDGICNRRKIITNNLQVRDLAFYSSSNIFCFENVDDIDVSSIVDFLEIPFDESVLPIVREYHIDKWVLRFFA